MCRKMVSADTIKVHLRKVHQVYAADASSVLNHAAPVSDSTVKQQLVNAAREQRGINGMIGDEELLSEFKVNF